MHIRMCPEDLEKWIQMVSFILIEAILLPKYSWAVNLRNLQSTDIFQWTLLLDLDEMYKT